MDRYAGPSADIEERVFAAIKDITGLRPFSFNAGKGPVSRGLQWASDRCLMVAMSLFFAAAPLSIVLNEARALQLYGTVPLVGLLFCTLIALAVPVLSILSEMAHLATFAFKPAALLAKEAAYDFACASNLLGHSDEALGLADTWLEQKIRRSERRMVRMLGGGDKVALLVVLGLVWAAWKSLEDPLFSRTTVASVNLGYCGLAFAAGLILGGMLLSRVLERLAFQRDMIGLARKRLAREADAQK